MSSVCLSVSVRVRYSPWLPPRLCVRVRAWTDAECTYVESLQEPLLSPSVSLPVLRSFCRTQWGVGARRTELSRALSLARCIARALCGRLVARFQREAGALR